jgi:hypothetical protein
MPGTVRAIADDPRPDGDYDLGGVAWLKAAGGCRITGTMSLSARSV